MSHPHFVATTIAKLRSCLVASHTLLGTKVAHTYAFVLHYIVLHLIPSLLMVFILSFCSTGLILVTLHKKKGKEEGVRHHDAW